MEYDYAGKSNYIRQTYPYACLMDIKAWGTGFSELLIKIRSIVKHDWCWSETVNNELVILFHNENDLIMFKLAI